MADDFYLFNLAYWPTSKDRPIVHAEIDGRAKVSQLEIGGQKFVLGEMGESDSREFLLKEAYDFAEQILSKYPTKLDSLHIEGGIFRSVKRGLIMNMSFEGEKNLRSIAEAEREIDAISREHPELGRLIKRGGQ
jgi:hypothetical protein